MIWRKTHRPYLSFFGPLSIQRNHLRRNRIVVNQTVGRQVVSPKCTMLATRARDSVAFPAKPQSPQNPLNSDPWAQASQLAAMMDEECEFDHILLSPYTCKKYQVDTIVELLIVDFERTYSESIRIVRSRDISCKL